MQHKHLDTLFSEVLVSFANKERRRHEGIAGVGHSCA